jgi:hypothetical protein|tara:strand:- start:182 stop:388 length:207 start_codon:yes stop_codon:yes gene_type:complete
VKNSQYDFTKKLLINTYISSVITDKKHKSNPHILTENELRKLSDEELDKYCSEIIKIIVDNYTEEEDY